MERVDHSENIARPLSMEEGASQALHREAFDRNCSKAGEAKVEKMPDKLLNENAKKMAECADAIAKAGANPTESHASTMARKEMQELCQEAEKSDQLKQLIAKANLQLAESGSEESVEMHSMHKQDKIWPELSPFDSWNQYTIGLKNGSLKEQEICKFDGKITHHPGIQRTDEVPSVHF